MDDTRNETSSKRSRPRISHACRTCRQRKVKCSGAFPCPNCTSRGLTCVYDEARKKVVILERHLRALQGRAASHPQPETNSPAESDLAASPQEAIASLHDDVDVSPDVSLGPRPSLTNIVTTSSPWRYLQAASNIVHGRARSFQDLSIKTYDHGSLDTLAAIGDSLTYRLPPRDIIARHIDVVDRHLNIPLHFFHPDTLRDRLSKGPTPFHIHTHNADIWQVQLLVVVALAKLFNEKDGPRKIPPGSRDFFLAEKLLPSHFKLLQDPITAAETLALLSWYAQAADLDDLASIYTGQALTLTHTSAFDASADADAADATLSDDRRNHPRRLRRTVNFIHNRLRRGNSSQVFTATPDVEHIQPEDAIDEALAVASAVSDVLGKAAQSEIDIRDLNGPDADHTQGLLKDLDVAGRRLNHLMTRPSNSATQPNCIRLLQLWYCHCAMIVTFPALLHVARPATSGSLIPRTGDQHILQQASFCLKYASASLAILTNLYNAGVLEAFSHFNLELVVMISSSILIAEFISGKSSSEPSLLNEALEMLRDMSLRGNVPAASALETLDELSKQAQSSLRTLTGIQASFIYPPSRMILDDDGLLEGEVLSILGSSVHVQAEPQLMGHDSHPAPATDALVGGAGVSLGDLWHDDDFTFDEEDLQWLDAVQ